MPPLKGWLMSAVVEANKPKESIIEMLRKRLAGYEEGRPREVVHASDITKPDFCPRHWAFLDMAGKKNGAGSYVPTALRVTYDMGHATAKLLIEEWAGDAIFGNWSCRRCGEQRTMAAKPRPGCKKHQDCIWEYQEVCVESNEFGVSGSFDALFDVGAPKLLLTELKTINPDEFAAIAAPLPEHRVRTSLYLKLLSDSHSPYRHGVNLHEGRVFYVSRSYGKKHEEYGEILPFKEFVVTRDDALIAPVLQKAKQLKVFREINTMPSGICATALDKAAKNCSTCVACFSGDHPSGQGPLA